MFTSKIYTMKKYFLNLNVLLLSLFAATAAFAQTKAKKAVVSSSPIVSPAAEPEMKPVMPVNGKDVIAIYPFTSAAGFNYDYAVSAGNAVEAGVVRSDRFTVVERSRFGMIREEERFKEANTADAVKKAAKLGAKTLITGHVIAVSAGVSRGLLNVLTNEAQISISFKVVDVETGEIKKSETILGRGNGSSLAAAMQKAYEEIDRQARAYIAEYLPQRFDYAGEEEVDKKGRLQKFKIWGGSGQGLKAGDMLQVYEVSYITRPGKSQPIQEKRLRGEARIKEVNSTETATCELQNANTIGEGLLNDLRNNPKNIVFEYKGKIRKGGLFN